MTIEIPAWFRQVRAEVDRALDHLVPPATTHPTSVHEAMRYSLFAGGKRLRPTLCVSACPRGLGDAAVVATASAIEMIHTYSLIHDDLPAMDDDDMRRGQPSCHKKFGEATAILAGDALLTLAFETLARLEGVPPEKALTVIALFARAAGSSAGMIAGQVMDIEAEGRGGSAGAWEAETIHRLKTGALISASVWSGAFLGGASDDDLTAIAIYGQRIGLAFQIIDDVLDITESPETLGKTAGKDRDHQKVTYPSVHGVEKSRRIAGELSREAQDAVRHLSQGPLLVALAQYLENRSH